MPELPEVETLKHEMNCAFAGHRIMHVAVRRHDLRCPVPQNLASLLQGKICKDFTRRGKYILMHLSPHGVVLLHLGMSGQILVKDVGKHNHEHVIFEMDDGVRWSYRDVRRFGFIDYLEEGDLKDDKRLRHLGMEPFSSAFTAQWLHKELQKSRKAMKDFLLDQQKIVGLGNIYACEVLFESGISPFAPADTLTVEQARKLLRAIHHVLSEATKKGGSTIKDCVHLDGSEGHYQKCHEVYGKEGLSCKVGDYGPCRRKGCQGVKMVRQGGRSTFYCPVKQGK